MKTGADAGIVRCKRCGGEAKMYRTGNGRFFIRCDTWKCNRWPQTRHQFGTEEKAVTYWNNQQIAMAQGTI